MKCAWLLLAMGCSSPSAPVPQDRPVTNDVVIDAAVALPRDPPPAPVGDLPIECGIYKALAAKLARCTQLGPQRALLEQQFETSWKAWTVLPQTERAGVAAGCRVGADALRVAVAPCT